MTDLSAVEALEPILYTTLAAAIVGATVYQHVPENTPPPVVIIGDLESEPAGGKGSDDAVITVTFDTIVEGEERKPVTALQRQIFTTLDDVTLVAGGWSYRCFEQAASASLMPDGATYYGRSEYKIDASRV